MLGYKILNLKLEDGKILHYNMNRINKAKNELLNTLMDYKISFDYSDVFKEEKSLREININKGYQFILDNSINKDSLKELYDILSNNLLDDYSKNNMGKYYRNNRVYITNPSTFFFDFSFTQGVKPENVDSLMNNIFNLINSNNSTNRIDNYVISQVIHYYLVYVHPYYDCNGRTARMLSSWFLCENNCTKFLLFDKFLDNHRDTYSKAIKKCKNGNITPFLEFMIYSLIYQIKFTYKNQKQKVKKRLTN